MSALKKSLKKIPWIRDRHLIATRWALRLFYPKFQPASGQHIRYQTLCFYGFFQRILRVNWQVPWPVHFTSKVSGWHKMEIAPGYPPGWSPGTYIQAFNGMIVEPECYLGPHVAFITANHDYHTGAMEAHLPADPIILRRGVWVGAHTTILPGVELGPGVIVGAGSVVTRSFPDGHVVIAGVPARVVRTLSASQQTPSNTP